MREIPVDDMMTHNAAIRDDGWVMRDLYLFRVKTPSESKAPWDYYKLLSKYQWPAGPRAQVRATASRRHFRIAEFDRNFRRAGVSGRSGA